MSGANVSENVIEVRRLQIAYATKEGMVHAVQDASLTIADGEAVGIAGESGSGKSTLARAALGLLPAGVARILSGQLVILGRDVTKFTHRQWESLRGNPVAMVFSDPLSFLNPVLRVGDQIAESVRRHDRAVNPTARSIELLELVKLQRSVFRRYPHELSGGMRQRVLMAIALGCRPRLLIADEPTTALDVTTQREILSLLEELRSTLKMSLLLISHDLGLLRWNCDRAYIMYAGYTIETGATSEVLAHPAHPYTKGLVAASRLQRGPDDHFETVNGDVPGLTRQFSICPFQPRCLSRIEKCDTTMPHPLRDQGTEHDARCWLQHSVGE